MEAYIYTYVNKESGKTYIGSRSAYKGSCYDDFNIKYFSSSKNKEFRQDMADGKLEGLIVLVMNDPKANKKIVEVEHKMIDAYWEKYGKEMSYNHHNNGGKFSVAGMKLPKLSEKLKGRKLTEETKQKISESKKGRKHTEEHKQKISNTLKGQFHYISEETKQKISNTLKGHTPCNKGVPMSEEQKKKISFTKSIKYKWLTPNGEIKEMDLSNAHRYHKDWIKIEE